MKILQVTTPESFTIQDVPVPDPGPGEVLMRVTAVTTCPQWDLHLRHNEPMFVGHQFHYPYTPGQPGHEAVGYIEAVGREVSGLTLGQRVCAWRDQGHQNPGCYAQYAILQAENVIPAPENLDDKALAPFELAMCVGTVFRTLRQMDVLEGRRIGITGLGPAGLVALQMARAEGAAAVTGFDPNPGRRETALGLGADACYDPRADLPQRFGDLPLDTSIDCVGAKESVEFLLDITGDVVALFGVQRQDYTYRPRHNRVTLCGYKGHSRQSADYAMRLIRAGKLDLAPLVTHSFPLHEYGRAIDLLEGQQALKVCLLPWA